MGDVSVIARRLEDGKVQYGWGGNGGVFSFLGAQLLYWYDSREMVDYLFDLGQLSLVGEPYSEHGSRTFRNRPTGEPHWVGESEREIFSKIAFVDMGYFYDLDNTWYYVVPGPFRIKIPLQLMSNCVGPKEDRSYWEDDFRREVDRRLVDTIRTRYDTDDDFRAYLSVHDCDRARFMEIMEAVTHVERSWETQAYMLWDKHRFIFDYFDDWAVVRGNEDNTEIRCVQLMKKGDCHKETLGWEDGD